MPRKNPLPEREIKISGRVHDMRRFFGFSRTEFAHSIGLPMEKLKRVELARMALPYDMAKAILDHMNGDPVWLATGDGSPRQGAFSMPGLPLSASPGALFTSVFDAWVADVVAGLRFETRRLTTVRRLQSALEHHIDRVPSERLELFAEKVLALIPEAAKAVGWDDGDIVRGRARRILRRFADAGLVDSDTPKLITTRLGPESPFVNQCLTEWQNPSTIGPVTKNIRSLPELVNELRNRTRQRGAKASLARDLKVSRQAVNQWLSGESTPSGETALALLKWVEEH